MARRKNSRPALAGPSGPRSTRPAPPGAPRKTTAVFFPFDLFGSAGSGAGADLIADELREILADNRRERTPTRAQAYDGRVLLHSFALETLPAYQDWRTKARREVRRLLDRGEFLFWVTGNHLGALPVYEELGRETLVVQLDAHLDIHQFSDCTRELSHGNFLRHCSGPLPRVVNVGHRELLLRPEDIGGYYHRTYPAEVMALAAQDTLDQLRQLARQARQVFLDLDCDVFDPAWFPAVTQPLPFGLSPFQVLQVIDAVWTERLIGLAISEFAPGRDRADQGLALLMWLIEYLLLKVHEPRHPRRQERRGERPVS